MRFKNMSSSGRYFTYGGRHKGKSIKSGGVSPELPMATLFSKYLIKDVMTGKADIILNKKETEYLKTVLGSNKKIKEKSKSEQVYSATSKRPQRLLNYDGSLRNELPKEPNPSGTELDENREKELIKSKPVKPKNSKKKVTTEVEKVEVPESKVEAEKVETQESKVESKKVETKTKNNSSTKPKKTNKVKKESAMDKLVEAGDASFEMPKPHDFSLADLNT